MKYLDFYAKIFKEESLKYRYEVFYKTKLELILNTIEKVKNGDFVESWAFTDLVSYLKGFTIAPKLDFRQVGNCRKIHSFCADKYRMDKKYKVNASLFCEKYQEMKDFLVSSEFFVKILSFECWKIENSNELQIA